MNVKVDKFGRLDPTTMTAIERRKYTLNCIHRHILDNHSPIAPTDESIAEWLTLDDPSVFWETMTLGGKAYTEEDEGVNKINAAISQLKELAESIPAGTQHDKTFKSIVQIIEEIRSLEFQTTFGTQKLRD